MPEKPLLPAPLMKAAHLAPFDAIIRNYIGNAMDLTGTDPLYGQATILNIDTVPADILPYLAVMFGVEGFKGFDYASTEALQRQTIKDAVLKKRRHGTPWSVKTALQNAGYSNVIIHEHIYSAAQWNDFNWDEADWSDGYLNWACFKVQLSLPAGAPIYGQPNYFQYIEDRKREIRLLVNYWKRACTFMIEIIINQLAITSIGGTNAALTAWDEFDWDDAEWAA